MVLQTVGKSVHQIEIDVQVHCCVQQIKFSTKGENLLGGDDDGSNVANGEGEH